MRNEKLKNLLILGSSITAIGFILLFFSVNIGLSLADNRVFKQGGMDTSIYLIVAEGYTNNILVAGSILFGVGISTIIFAYYKMLNIDK